MAAANESPAHAADRFLAVEGARLRFRDEGSGPALVLLHGWTLDLEMWDAQMAALADQFRLVRFDRRGHGLSSGPPAPDGDASDVAALCGHLQLGEVGVVGMSQGARAALAFAQASPQRVRALLLDGPPTLTSGVVDDDVPLAQFRALVRRHGLAGFRSAWMRHPLTQLRTPDPEVRQRLAAMVDRFAAYELSTPAPAAPRPAPAASRSDRRSRAHRQRSGRPAEPTRVRRAPRGPAAARAAGLDRRGGAPAEPRPSRRVQPAVPGLFPAAHEGAARALRSHRGQGTCRLLQQLGPHRGHGVCAG